jgi:hypothetical protein
MLVPSLSWLNVDFEVQAGGRKTFLSAVPGTSTVGPSPGPMSLRARMIDTSVQACSFESLIHGMFHVLIV